MTYLPIQKEIYFKRALKAVLTKNRHQQSVFDDLYVEFWQQLSRATDAKLKDVEERRPQQSDSQKRQAQFESLKDWLNLHPSEEEKEVSSFSGIEVLTKKDFVDLSEEEMHLMMRLLQKMARRMAHVMLAGITRGKKPCIAPKCRFKFGANLIGYGQSRGVCYITSSSHALFHS